MNASRDCEEGGNTNLCHFKLCIKCDLTRGFLAIIILNLAIKKIIKGFWRLKVQRWRVNIFTWKDLVSLELILNLQELSYTLLNKT